MTSTNDKCLTPQRCKTNEKHTYHKLLQFIIAKLTYKSLHFKNNCNVINCTDLSEKKIKYSFTNVPVHYYFCLIYDAGPLCQRYLKQTPLLNSGLNGNCRRKKCFCQFFRKTRAFGNFYCMSTVANSGNSLQF